MTKDKVHQCKSCPWRVTCVPDKDIPNYSPKLAAGLTNTIRSGLETLFERERHVMACHYSKPGEEFPCAGPSRTRTRVSGHAATNASRSATTCT